MDNKLYNIKDLKNAIDTIVFFNDMSFNEFCDLLESKYGEKISEKEKEMFRFTGLNNTDFYKFFNNGIYFKSDN